MATSKSRVYYLLRLGYRKPSVDRFLTTQIHYPSEVSEELALLFVVEVLNPSEQTNQLGQQVINTVVREFTAKSELSISDRFEASLASANSIISKLTAQLESPIDCLVGLVQGTTVQIATVGQPTIFVAKTNRLADISPSRRKDFNEITSGTIENGEVLIFANRIIGRTLPQLGRQTWQFTNIKTIKKYLASLLTLEPIERQVAIFLSRQPFGSNQNQSTIYWEDLEARIPIRLPNIQLVRLPDLRPFVTSMRVLVQNLWRLAQRNNLEVDPDKTEKTSPVNKLPRNVRRAVALLLVIAPLTAAVIGLRHQFTRNKVTISLPATIDQQLATIGPADLAHFLATTFNQSLFNQLSDAERSNFNAELAKQSIQLVGSPTLVAELPSPITALSSSSDGLFLIDQPGQLWSLSSTNLPVKINQQIVLTNPVSLVAINNQRIIVSDSVGNIWLYNNQPDQPKTISLPSTVASDQKLVAVFADNLYLADLRDRSIWRQAKFDQDLSKISSYIKSATINLETISDWGINGQIILVDNRGRVINFLANKAGKLDFTASYISTPPHLAVNSQIPFIYIASDRLISRYSTDGQLKTTWFVATSKPLTDIELDKSGQLLWFSAGEDLFKLLVSQS